MYRKCTAFLLVASCFLLVGCGDSHEKVMRDSLAQMKKMMDVLENVKSADDAKAAKGKLDSIAKKMKSIEARMKKLGEPDPELAEQLKTKFQSEFTELMPRMFKVMGGMSEEVRKEIGSSMGEMPMGL